MQKGQTRTEAQKREYREKLRLAGIKRFGSEALWRLHLRESSAKSRRNHKGNGYFATLKITDPAKLKEIGSKGLKERWSGERRTTGI